MYSKDFGNLFLNGGLKYIMEVFILILICTLIAAIVLRVIYLLKKIDSETEYSYENTPPNFTGENGSLYITIPYYAWQTKKLAAINKLYSKEFIFDEKRYITKCHWNDKNNAISDTVPQNSLSERIFKNYYALVDLAVPTMYNNTIIGNNNFIGNNNKVNNNPSIHTISINKTDKDEIIKNINSLIDSEIDNSIKNELKNFKNDLSTNNVTHKKCNKLCLVLEKLSKQAPYVNLVTSLINLLRTIN